MTANKIVFQPSERQEEFIRAVLSNKYRYLLYGGAMAGGKEQPYSADVVTPFGLRKMGDLEVGSVVSNPDGGTSRVISIHEQGVKDVYRLTLADGAHVECGEDHLWQGHFPMSGRRKDKRGDRSLDRVWVLKDLIDRVNTGEPFLVPTTKPVQFTRPHSNKWGEFRPIDPYALGALLGDGSFRTSQVSFTSVDSEIVEAVCGAVPGRWRHDGISYRLSDGGALKEILASLDLWGKRSEEKRVPEHYKWAPIEDRLAILQGLMDTDGTVCKRGQTYYASSSHQLATDVKWLVESLGGWAKITLKETSHLPCYIVYIQHEDRSSLFRLRRKKERCVEPPTSVKDHGRYRRIVKIEKVRREQSRCITVDHPNSLYLTGNFVVTHNTVILVILATILCKAFKGSRWAIVRKDLPRLRRNFLPTWERFASPNFFGPVNQSTWTVKARNGSEIVFFPASEEKDRDHDRLRGLELSGAMVDECNEVSESFLSVLMTRCGRWPSSPKCPPMVVMTCNPTQTWPKQKFFTPWQEGKIEAPYYYLPAKVTDNPFLDKTYLEALQDLPPHVYRVLVDGDWSAADESDQLIQTPWIEAALQRDPVEGMILPPRLGVDVARYGDDETTIARTINYHLAEILSYKGIDTQRTAQIVLQQAAAHGVAPEDIRVDTVGVGGGVADALGASGLKPVEFIGGASPTSKDWTPEQRKFLNFRNLRAESWWNLREVFRLEHVSIGDLDDITKVKLIADLTAPTFKVDNDKYIEVDSKPIIKKRIGRSPDYADALAMAWADMPKPERFFFASV